MKRPPRIRALRPRTAVAAPRLTVPKVELADPGSDARRILYQSPRWAKVRAGILAKQPACIICGDTERLHVDHLLGHDPVWMRPLERTLGLDLSTDWRARFWSGPFVALCHHHHAIKTGWERHGRLAAWIRDNADALGLSHISW